MFSLDLVDPTLLLCAGCPGFFTTQHQGQLTSTRAGRAMEVP